MLSIGSAPLFDRLRVVRLVLADLALSASLRRGAETLSVRLLVPARCRDAVDLQLVHTATGAEACQVSEAEDLVISLQGVEEQIASAVWRLHQKLEPWEPFEVPERTQEAPKERSQEREPRASFFRQPARGDDAPSVASRAPAAGSMSKDAGMPHDASAAARDAGSVVPLQACQGPPPGAPLPRGEAASGISLQLLVSKAAAAFAAEQSLTRPGVRLRVLEEAGAAECVLEIAGPAHASAVTCYLLQASLWLAGMKCSAP